MRSKLLAVSLLATLFAGVVAAQTTFIDENFSTATGSTPPTGWTVNNISGDAVEIWRFDNPGGRTLNAPISAPAAIFDSDNYGGVSGNENCALESPAFNAATATEVWLEWDQYFLGGFGGAAFVEVFNGSSWVQVYTTTATTSNPNSQGIDISAQAAGVSNAQVRFRWTGDWSWYWIVDNVLVTDTLPNFAPEISVARNATTTIVKDSTIVVRLNDTVASLGLTFDVTDQNASDEVSLTATVTPSANIDQFVQAEWNIAQAAQPVTAAAPSTGVFDTLGLITVTLDAADNASGTASLTFYILVVESGTAAGFTVTGTIDATDTQQLGRIFRDGNPQIASAPKAYPGIFNAATSYSFETIIVTNTSATPIQIQVVFTATTANQIHVTAHTTTYDPANQGAGFNGDSGSSAIGGTGAAQGFSAIVPAATDYVLAIFNPNVGSFDSYTVTVYESAQNNAPVLDNSGTSTLTAIAQDIPAGSNTGDTIGAIIATGAGGDPITDADAGAVEGIAVTAVDNTNGVWEFSTDAGATWNPINIPAFHVLTLADNANTRIRFTPNASFTGLVATGLTFRAWDQTNGENGELMLVSPVGTGNVSSLSADTETAEITVNAQAAVTVTGIAPDTGPEAGGQTVTITGTEFGASSTVTIGGAAATGVVVNSSTSITCVTPAGTLGSASVEVTSNGQTNSANTLYTYSNNAPPTLALGTPSGFADLGGNTFRIAVDPGANVVNGNLQVADATPDNVDMTITFTGGPMGMTVPSGFTVPGSQTVTGASMPFTIQWGGTAGAGDAPGDYEWDVELDDGTTTVNYTVIVRINDLDPETTAATGVTGDGSSGDPYALTIQIGATAGVDVADLTDPNAGQDVSFDSQSLDSRPGGSTLDFTFSVTPGNPTVLVATPDTAPVLADVGDHAYEVFVEDDAGNTITISVVITVAGTAPAFTSGTPPATVAEGIAFSFTFTASGNPAPTFAVTTGTLPAWATLNPTTGELSGTPVLTEDISVTISAQNGIAPDATLAITITVAAAAAPSITSGAPTATATVGTLYSFTVVATGNPTPTFSIAGNPAWLSINPTTGVVSGTPSAGDVGTTGTIIVTASNGVTPDDDVSWTITVSAAGTGGGGGGSKKKSGCSTDESSSYLLLALLGLIGAVVVSTRLRRA